jgi:hypothetical protein
MLDMKPDKRQHLGPQHPVNGPDGEEARPQGRNHVERHRRRQGVGYERRADDVEQGDDPEYGQDRKALERRALFLPPLRGCPGEVQEADAEEDCIFLVRKRKRIGAVVCLRLIQLPL